MSEPHERIEELWNVAFDAAERALDCARATLGDEETRRRALSLRDERLRTTELLSSLRLFLGPASDEFRCQPRSPSTEQTTLSSVHRMARPRRRPTGATAGKSVLVRSRNTQSRRRRRRSSRLRSS